MPLSLVLSALLLSVAAIGVGHLVRSLARGDSDPPCSVAITFLVGVGALAALLPNLFVAGLSRPLALTVAFTLAVAGWALAAKRRRAFGRPGGIAILTALLTAAALASPGVLAFTEPVLAHDTVLIWWPKMEEVAQGQWPVLVDTSPIHAHTEYPRGLAWLVSLASPWAMPDPRLVKVIPLLVTWVTALAMAAVAGAATRPGYGLLIALLFVLVPDVAQWSHAGYADLPVAAMVLLAGVGLTQRRVARDGAMIAAIAALGAASIKEEGAIVALAVAFVLGLDLLRERGRRVAAAVALASFAVIVPWWSLRAGAPGGVLGTIRHLIEGPELLMLRAAEVARDVGLLLVDPAALVDHGEPVGIMPIPWAGWIVLVAVVVLLPRGPRPLVAFPALLLLLADLAIYVVTPSPVRWHIRTSFGRLLIQVMPLLMLAATLRLTVRACPASHPGQRARQAEPAAAGS